MAETFSKRERRKKKIERRREKELRRAERREMPVKQKSLEEMMALDISEGPCQRFRSNRATLKDHTII